MLRYAILAAREIRKNGGRVSFEWPTEALGWETKECQDMIKEFGLETVTFHGCNVGLKSRKNPTLALKKPWTIATDSQYVIRAFCSRQCSKDHVHDLCEGGNAEASGYYPPEMARLIVRAFMKEDVVRRIANHVSTTTAGHESE
jgi:hypothetical protein